MTPPTLDMHPVMRLQRLGSVVAVQPWRDGAVAGESLTVDLETGTLAVTEHPPIDSGDYTTVYGVLGLASFEAGPALVVVTGVQEVARLRGHPLLRVTATAVLADTSNRKWKAADHRFLDLLRAGVDPERHGGQMYFAPGGDPTLTQQRHADAVADAATYAATPAWRRAEPAFFWNGALAAPLLDAGAAAFVPTAFVGFAQQLPDLDFSRGSKPCVATVTLIARRSARRAGTRQWRRGADADADVANFVESEQLVAFDGGGALLSFVQVRGSIPLLWAQTPCLKYKIPIAVAPPSKCEPVLAAHARQLAARYGAVTAINLANQSGREGKLSAAYAAAADALASPSFRLVPFDFHKQCGATNYKNLEILWAAVAGDFEAAGVWHCDAATGEAGRQAGVFRTNCIDTLDRTNVVQGLLARRALEATLRRRGALGEGETLAAAFPAAEVAFRVMWADHGDEISRQYAGTGAMKSAFTRTGKRDLAGLADDGAKSLTRYFLNNFRDGAKQDALDLVTGAYEVTPGRAPPAAPQGSPALPLAAAAALAVAAAAAARRLAAAGQLGLTPEMARQVAVPLLLAVLVLRLVARFGRHLVDRPALRPDLAVPWR